MMKKYKVEYERFRFYGECSYCYAVIESYTGSTVRTGFSTEYEAIYWAINDGGISIVDLDTSHVY